MRLNILALSSYLCLVKSLATQYSYYNISIYTLRRMIMDEVKYKEIDTSDTLILDNICALDNITGICYFNSAIQALFADRKFLLFLIMHKFEKKHKVCIIMQKIAYKMLTNNTACLLKNLIELDELSTYEQCPISFHATKGGHAHECIHALLVYMNREVRHLHIPGSPICFFLHDYIEFICENCNSYNLQNLSLNPYHVLSIGNDFAKSFERSFNITRKKYIGLMHNCNQCKSLRTRNISNYYQILPDNLFLFINVEDGPKELHNAINFQESISIGKYIYELYSVICKEKNSISSHEYSIAKRNGTWYVFDNGFACETRYIDKKLIHNKAEVFSYRKRK